MAKQEIHKLVQTHIQALAAEQAREQAHQSDAQVRAEGVARATRAIADSYPDEVAAALYARAYARARCLYYQRAPIDADGNIICADSTIADSTIANSTISNSTIANSTIADRQKELLADARRAEREFPEMGAYDAQARGAIVDLALAYALNFDIDDS